MADAIRWILGLEGRLLYGSDSAARLSCDEPIVANNERTLLAATVTRHDRCNGIWKPYFHGRDMVVRWT